MIQWTDTLATGHAVVDADHRKLIDSLNQLEESLRNGAGKENIPNILKFLDTYTREHFAREEAHMKAVGCPAYQENCREHALLVSRLDTWLERLGQGASITLVLEVHREIANWIRNHIIKTDCKLRGCVQK
ncbi:MAG: hemerythrin family protein [Nibricoccus sp.]